MLVDVVFKALVNTKLGDAVGNELGLVLMSKNDSLQALPTSATNAIIKNDFNFMFSQL
jgi:hypothetical protein